MPTFLILSLLLGPLAGLAVAQQAEWNDQAVEAALGRGREFLWSQWSQGHWSEQGKEGAREGAGYAVNHGGLTALCAYALLSAGEDPRQERMKQTLAWLAKVPMHGTYARSFRACVWSSLGRNSPYRQNLAEDVKWLISAADARGAYDYHPPKGAPPRNLDDLRYDNSNSQLAALAVWAGARAGVEVPPEYWKRVEKHWLSDQQPDGGWTYQSSGPRSYGSMSAAGLATMFICLDTLHGGDYVALGASAEYPPVTRGLAWLNGHFSVSENPGKGAQQYYYYLFCLERVGLAGGYKYLGGQDWYKGGTLALLRQQAAGGGWGDLPDTAFAVLFLARGRHPVLFNKLKYDGTWNCRPRDLANLAGWISSTFEREVHWQIVEASAPVADWQDAPILYISGASAPNFSDAEVEKLRQFVLQGGTIFSEAAGSRSAFTLAMQKYYAGMFPQYPLGRLEDGHPIYSAYFKTGRGLSGVSNGVRLLAVHSAEELSLPWQVNDTRDRADAFRLAANVYFHVTDRGSLRQRGTSPWPTARAFEPLGRIRLAVVKHGGNWNPEPLAWQRLAILAGNLHRISVEVCGPADPRDLEAARWPAAALTGAGPLELSEPQRAGLKKYLADGGTLVVDAAGGNAAFAGSAEKLLADLLPDAKAGPLPANHAVYTGRGLGPPGAGDLAIAKVAYRRSLRPGVGAPDRPRLISYVQNGRIKAILSREDITCGLVGYPCSGLEGYEPRSAFELMRNILLYANGKGPADPAGYRAKTGRPFLGTAF